MKSITCEGWKKIVGTEKCKYTVVTSTVTGDAINPRRDPPNSIWCSDTADITDTYINLPVDYEYATSDEKCIYDVIVNLYSGQETNKAGTAGSQQSTTTQTKEFEEPAGRGIGEFIRKIQGLRLGPADQDEKSQQEVIQEPSKSSPQSVNDWILENVGVYEPSITVLNETPFKNREPLIKQGQPNASSVIRKVAESSLIPGTRISNYAEGVMVEISKGGWVYIPPSGEVIYGTREWRRYFDVMTGTVEVETNENSTEVKTPNATVNTKGTHYWVSYDADKKKTVVGVYEGKVEVKTRDGKTTTISPDGDKPGVVMFTQKLSPVKLILVGLALAAVVGGTVWFVKRKKKR